MALIVSETKKRNDAVDNFRRKHMIMFRYPSNGHIYAALAFEAFISLSVAGPDPYETATP